MKRWNYFIGLFLFGMGMLNAFGQAANSNRPDLVLEGEVHGTDNHSYIEVPFRVPEGMQRVTITFAYTGKEQRTALDLGLSDPDGLRCWSGGNKSVLTVASSDATPSCITGHIVAGEWRVLIGVPNIRAQSTAHYTIQVFFTRTGLIADEPAILREPLRTGPAWYRGDLHMHTGHSDGQCPSQNGKMVPCPVFITVDAAARRGLDFIAITDHNTASHDEDIRELQPYFDKLLLIPGREITTFQGHMNLIGTTQFFDFRLGSSHVPQINDLLHSARQTGALFSINHPNSPSGEICFGCGWTPAEAADMRSVDSIEVINGGSDNPARSGISFWEHQLNRGYRLTAIGGSDNHRPLRPLDKLGSVGWPTTIVFAENLSTPAILAGIRAGHVFVDLNGSPNRMLEMTANCGVESGHMGDMLMASSGSHVAFTVKASGVPAGSRIVLFKDGAQLDTENPEQNASGISVRGMWSSDGQRHWIRANVVGPDEKLLLLGNPIYLNWQSGRLK